MEESYLVRYCEEGPIDDKSKIIYGTYLTNNRNFNWDMILKYDSIKWDFTIINNRLYNKSLLFEEFHKMTADSPRYKFIANKINKYYCPKIHIIDIPELLNRMINEYIESLNMYDSDYSDCEKEPEVIINVIDIQNNMYKNPNLTKQIMDNFPEFKWNYDEFIANSPNFNHNEINEMTETKLKFYSRNPHINLKFLIQNTHYDFWDRYALAKNPAINFKIAKLYNLHTEYPLTLVGNPGLTYGDILQLPLDKFEMYGYMGLNIYDIIKPLCENKSLTLENVESIVNHFNLKIFVKNYVVLSYVKNEYYYYNFYKAHPERLAKTKLRTSIFKNELLSFSFIQKNNIPK